MYCVKETYAVYHTKNCNIKSNDLEGADRFDLDICVYIYNLFGIPAPAPIRYLSQRFVARETPQTHVNKYYPEFKAIQYEIC